MIIKSATLILLLALINLSSSCLNLSFDIKSWDRIRAEAQKPKNVDVTMTLLETRSSMIGNKRGGPWKLFVAHRSVGLKRVEIVRATMRCDQGELEILSSPAILPPNKYSDEHPWINQWSHENCPITVNPKYSDEQKLFITVYFRIDSGTTMKFSEVFKPRHTTGRETVNLLTM